jgi:hypothetical protein
MGDKGSRIWEEEMGMEGKSSESGVADSKERRGVTSAELDLQTFVAALRRRGLEGSVIDHAEKFLYKKGSWEILASDIRARDERETMAFSVLHDNLVNNHGLFEQFVSMPIPDSFVPTVKSAVETLFSTRADQALRLLRLYGVSESGNAPWVPEWRAMTFNKVAKVMDPQTVLELYRFQQHCYHLDRKEFDVRLREGVQFFDIFDKQGPQETKLFVWNCAIEQQGWQKVCIVAKINNTDRLVMRYLDTLVWEEEEGLVLLPIEATERRSYLAGIRVTIESCTQNTNGQPLYVLDAFNLRMLFSPEEWPRGI